MFARGHDEEVRVGAGDDLPLRFALPKGRMYTGIAALLEDAGIRVRGDARGYRPSVNLSGFEVKILKPQNIVEMLHLGSRDVGFAGADWVAELQADLVELIDTELDPVQVVAAAPESLLQEGKLPSTPLVVASEYERLAHLWIDKAGIQATFVRSARSSGACARNVAICVENAIFYDKRRHTSRGQRGEYAIAQYLSSSYLSSSATAI